jgi:hypothetical protein
MLFIHTWKLVVEEGKTLTSRLAYKNQEGEYVCRYKVGHTYGVQQKFYGSSIARIEVIEVWLCERARDISDEDARAEGFENAEAYRAGCEKFFGLAYLDKPVFRIRFKLVSIIQERLRFIQQ